MDPNGKVAIVTGGATGLGRAITGKLADAGAIVAVNHPAPDAGEARVTLSQIVDAGGAAVAVEADVSSAIQVAAMVEEVVESFGAIDILVNCAGTTVFVDFKDLAGLKESDWDRIFAVNVKGPFLCAQAVVPHMQEREAGVIVTITSGSGLSPGGSSIAYSASKAALEMTNKCMAQALGPQIRVNTVAPGMLATRWGARFGKEGLERRRQSLPLKRLTTVEDVAETVLFAVRNDSVTGSTLLVDAGGSTIR